MKHFQVICLILLLIMPYSGIAQESTKEEEPFRKNAFYGSVGTLGLYFTATGSYERILMQNTYQWNTEQAGLSPLQKKRFATFAKISYGGYTAYSDNGRYATAQVGILRGKKHSLFELAFGLAYHTNSLLSSDFFTPSGSLGLRGQSPRGILLYRIGIGYPEMLYIGLGFSI